MFPIIKYKVRREKIKFYWKKFPLKLSKNKIFFCTPVSKVEEVLTLNICKGAKQIYPKKPKTKF